MRASGPDAALPAASSRPTASSCWSAARAADNDVLTFKIGAPRDFWLHVAADSGSHVVVRNPDGVASLPRDTVQFAAGLAAGYSKLRDGGRVAVHLCTCADVGKPRGMPPGKVHHRALQDGAREADHHRGHRGATEENLSLPLWPSVSVVCSSGSSSRCAPGRLRRGGAKQVSA